MRVASQRSDVYTWFPNLTAFQNFQERLWNYIFQDFSLPVFGIRIANREWYVSTFLQMKLKQWSDPMYWEEKKNEE